MPECHKATAAGKPCKVDTLCQFEQSWQARQAQLAFPTSCTSQQGSRAPHGKRRKGSSKLRLAKVHNPAMTQEIGGQRETGLQSPFQKLQTPVAEVRGSGPREAAIETTGGPGPSPRSLRLVENFHQAQGLGQGLQLNLFGPFVLKPGRKRQARRAQQFRLRQAGRKNSTILTLLAEGSPTQFTGNALSRGPLVG